MSFWICFRSGLFALLVTLLIVLASTAHANRGRGRHEQLYVVPTPGEVKIDANLDDWDLSGQIEMFVVEATRSTQSAELAAMYDDGALYISGEVRDPNPMMNRHDPAVKPHRAWDADACQFRIVADGDSEFPVKEGTFGKVDESRTDIVHILMWHYTDDKKPYLQVHTSMGYNAPRKEWEPHGLVPEEHFDGAFRKWENGRGYTFEYRVPWETLSADSPPGAGDVVAGTAQVHWSRPDGLATAGGRAWAYDIMREPGFPFQSTACWGKLIFTDKGNVPEELVMQGVPPERPLPLEFEYELPDDGEATIQIQDENGIVKRILVAQGERLGGTNVERWDGMDNHGEVDGHGGFIQPGKYQWKGTFNEERLRAKYRFSVHNSGQPPYMTGDGTGGWGGDHGTPQDVARLDDGLLLSWSGAEHGFSIIRVDFDGNKVWGCSGRRMHPRHIATDGERVYYNDGAQVSMIEVSTSRPTSFPDGKGSTTPPPGGEGDNNRITGLAYADGMLHVAYGPRDLIGIYDARNGSLTGTVEVKQPGRMASCPDGGLAVISGDKVVNVAGREVTDWVSTHLDNPTGIAVGADDLLYVANAGELQNVSVFNADGEYVRSIGRKGGRPAMGRYDPSGIYQPGGIALGAPGELWVAETTDFPKRISVWNVKSGENIDEFFGAAGYFAYGNIDPANPDEIYAHNVLWEIDWDNYTTKPKTTIWRRTDPNMAPHPNISGLRGLFRMFTADNGRQFAIAGSPVVLYMRDGDLFRPIAGMINPWRTNYPALAERKEKITRQWDEQGLRGYKRPRDLFWQDQNGDGRVAPEEVTVRDGVGSVVHMDKDLTLWLRDGKKIKPQKVTEGGRPVYRLEDAEETPLTGKSLRHGWTNFDDEGAVYTVSVTGKGSEGSGLSRWSPDGELVWRYPNIIRWRDAISLPSAGPGKLWSMTRPMGVAGEYLATQTYMGVNHIFRRDGMYVGAVLGGGPSGRLDPDQEDAIYDSQPEGQGGSFVKLTIDGEDRYFLIHGGHDVKVWEVLGIETLQDLTGGTYVHTEKDLEVARKAYQEYMEEKEGAESIRIVRGRDGLADAPSVQKRIEGNRGFKARMAYDEDNLYVRYDVESPHGLVNSFADPQVIFRGGNLIDIQIATNPDADPEREKPVPGDLRLLVTRQNGKPFSVLYRPRVEGFEGERIVLSSPTGEEPFDSIEVVDSVGLDYSKNAAGFSATVTLPLDLIDLELRPGQEIRLDLGYVFGNPQGNDAQRRVYLNNSSFSASVVDDIPNESRIEPDEWGTGEVR